MLEADSTIPLPAAPESNRAFLQALAEHVGLLVPGASLSHQQLKQGRIGGGEPT